MLTRKRALFPLIALLLGSSGLTWARGRGSAPTSNLTRQGPRDIASRRPQTPGPGRRITQIKQINLNGQTNQTKQTKQPKQTKQKYQIEDKEQIRLTLNRTTRQPGFKAGEPDGPTWKDVGGLDAEVKELREMLEYPRTHSRLYETLGIPPVSGVLLHGPVGAGKTWLGKVLRGALKESFVGVSATEIPAGDAGGGAGCPSGACGGGAGGQSADPMEQLLETASTKPGGGVLLIDDVDKLSKPQVARLKALMDRQGYQSKVQLVGLTDTLADVDPSLRRPGIFARELKIGLPDRQGRQRILEILAGKSPALASLDLAEVARRTPGFAGGDLVTLIQTVGQLAGARAHESKGKGNGGVAVVAAADLEAALKKVEPAGLRKLGVAIERPDLTWDQVGGVDAEKALLKEFAEGVLTNSEGFKRLGVRPPTGAMLVGPPGVGKTHMVRALANLLGCNVMVVKGSDTFNMWYGESTRKLREYFDAAKENAPLLLFFDEAESFFPRRGRSANGGVMEDDRVVTEALAQMDGWQKSKGVYTVFATNRPQLIDEAIVRSGRIDDTIVLTMPDERGRADIFRAQTQKMKVARDVDLTKLAQQAQGLSGADIAKVCSRAGLLALRENRDAQAIEMRHFVQAIKSTSPTVSAETAEYYENLKRGTLQLKPAEQPAGSDTGTGRGSWGTAFGQ